MRREKKKKDDFTSGIGTLGKTRTSDECQLHAPAPRFDGSIMEGRLKNEASSPKNSPESNPVYVCANCGTTLFEAAKKFNAGCGFPSFWMHNENNVKQNLLQTYGRMRIQLLCNNCGAHLGHLFNNKHTPTGLRYCINENAILLKG